MIQVSIPDITIIHEEELLSSGFLGKLRFSNKSFQIDDTRFFLYRNQSLIIIISK
ncbi:hypothetical protein D3C85_1858350 [compost metagenome]